MAREIHIGTGEIAIVDDDFKTPLTLITRNPINYCYSKNGSKNYAIKHVVCRQDRKNAYLHAQVWEYFNGENPVIKGSCVYEHINGDTLDCRILNLRVIDIALQQQNRSLSPRNTSRYRGVSKVSKGYWRASFTYKGNRQTKSFPFTDAGLSGAAHWYDARARECYGDEAALNFPKVKSG